MSIPEKINTDIGTSEEGLKVAVIFNQKRAPKEGMPEDFYAEFDDISVPSAIKEALEMNGHKVDIIDANEGMFAALVNNKYDFAFNIAEGLNTSSRESQVPAILDMLGIPYTGSGVTTQAITLDKRRKKEILAFHGINTPQFQLFVTGNEPVDKRLRYPLFVKPNAEGSSKGINNNSIVNNEAELHKMIDYVIQNYKQSAIVEEYLPGREFTVAVLGNKDPVVLPIVEITFDYLPEHVNHIDSYEVKWIYDNPNNPIDPIVCPAKISQDLRKKIEDIVLRTYRVLDIVDFCRMDVRLDKDGEPHILDVNAIPGLMPDPKENSRFPKACFTAGMTYAEMINKVFNAAVERYKESGTRFN